MYRIAELEELLKCTYPIQVSSETQNKRMKNISAIQQMVRDSIDTNGLQYQITEERLHIFTTQAGEKIYIQYPGKESTQVGDKCRPLDFRPKIMLPNGEVIRDLVFADMWGLVEDLNSQQHRLLKLMAAIFFRMGRMTFHNEVDKDYAYEVLDSDGNIICAATRHLNWFEFGMDEEIMKALNYHADMLPIDSNISISLEAFLCFFELVLQNEDSKYYDKKKDLSSGRISTSDSMLLLSASLFGRIRLSVLLQRFVSGFGVARCNIGEVEAATDNLVRIVDRKKELVAFFKNEGIAYTDGCYITVNRQKYRVALKTNNPKIAILSISTNEAKRALESAGWSVTDIPTLTEDSEYESLIARYGITT